MKVATIWGWTWTYNTLKALRQCEDIEISAIVNMSDDWWSTWKLRDEYGVLPSWDIRRAIVALSDDEKSQILRKLFNYRFSWWWLGGHNLGNLMMMALEDIAWGYGKSVNMLEELFDVKWDVYPVTFESTRLLAQLENWEFVFWETNIDIPKHDGKLKIQKLYLLKEDYGKILKKIHEEDLGINKHIFTDLLKKFVDDKPQSNPKVDNVLNNADYIIIWPWDLYTSILPNILTWNIKNLLLHSKAKKIFVCNLFTKYWETHGFRLNNFLNIFEDYLGKDIFDTVIVHDREVYPVDKEILINYEKENKQKVEIFSDDKRIIRWDLIKQKDMARHSSDKLLNILKQVIR